MIIRSTWRTSTTTRRSSRRASTTATSPRTAPPVSTVVSSSEGISPPPLASRFNFSEVYSLLTFLPNFSAVEKNPILVTYTYRRLGCSSSALMLWFWSRYHHQIPLPMNFPQKGHLCFESRQSSLSMQQGRYSMLERKQCGVCRCVAF